MSMIFQFRVLSDEDDRFLRDYQVIYKATLLDFHDFICDDLGFDKQAMSSFYLSDGQWDKLREFTLIDVGGETQDQGPLTMDGVTLREIIRDNGDRLIYTFDVFSDRSLYMEMIGTYKAEDGSVYPRVTLAEGDPPSQFGGGGEDSIFDEAMDEFGGFEGDEAYDDDL